MNKILFFTLSLVMAITAYGQNSASVDTLQTASDSTSVGSHAEFSAVTSRSSETICRTWFIKPRTENLTPLSSR